jgi:hypothetical protein
MQAMRLSNVGQPDEHEVGANIIQTFRDNPSTGKREYYYKIELIHGEWDHTELPDVYPRTRRNKLRLVATFHTHPGPRGSRTRDLPNDMEGDIIDNHEPSPEDIAGAIKRQVPAFIVWGTEERYEIVKYNFPPVKLLATWECPTTPPEPPPPPPDFIEITADCGESGNNTSKFKNKTSEERKFRVKTDADWLTIGTSEPDGRLTVPAGQEATIHLSGSCDGCCGGPISKEATFSILQIEPDGSENLAGEQAVKLGCAANAEKCGKVIGDPHMCTHDGLRYEFHGVGEFVLAKTNDFEVQARHAALGKYSSLNSAVAMRYKEDRVAIYGGLPARVTVNGEEWVLSPGYEFWLPSGAILQRNENIITLSTPGYVFEAVLRSKWIGRIYVSVPPGSGSRGLLGDRNDDPKDDIRNATGDLLSAPVSFEDLYKNFGNSWRVTSKTSLFDYAEGESAEGFSDLEFPKRHTTLADFDAETKRKAEAACRKAGVTHALNLEDCIYDIAVTGDEEFAKDSVGRSSRGVRLEMKGSARKTATSADGITIELPAEGIASYPIDIRIDGIKQPYILLFAKPGSPIHTNAGAGTQTELKLGAKLVSLHVPYTPGSYELRLITTPDRRIVTSIPFRSTPPNAEIEAEDTAEAGGSIDVRIVGDISPNTRIQIVRADNPSLIIAGRNLRGGLNETVTISSLPRTKGEYEIRYVSATHLVVYAQKRLTIQ